MSRPPKMAKISAQLYYFGISFFYKTTVSLDSTTIQQRIIQLDAEFLSNSTEFTDMKMVITEDMHCASRARVGGEKRTLNSEGKLVKMPIKWDPNGWFARMTTQEHIYVYVHNVHATASNVLFSQLCQCLRVTTNELLDDSICTVHKNHLHLLPYMMDNKCLLKALVNKAGECPEDIDVQNYVERIKSVLDSGKITDTPCTKPGTTCNNWEEDDWTKRLFHCISDRYEVFYTAKEKFPYILSILRCSEIEDLGIWCLQGSPDLMFCQAGVVVGSHYSGGDSNDSESSDDESLEEAFQKPPLKGYKGAGHPEKLGEAISHVYVILVSKYIRAIQKRRPLKGLTSKGLLMDKELGSVHISLGTCEWVDNTKLYLTCGLVSDYVHLSKKRVCYHLTKLTTRSPSPQSNIS